MYQTEASGRLEPAALISYVGMVTIPVDLFSTVFTCIHYSDYSQ